MAWQTLLINIMKKLCITFPDTFSTKGPLMFNTIPMEPVT